MRINGFSDNPPDAYMSNWKPDAEKAAGDPTSIGQPGSGTPAASDGAQLSKLSSVLNGLESGASAICRHVQQAMNAVRGGTYSVDPLQLSKRIIGEALGAA